MLVVTDRFRRAELAEAIADYERWLREPDDEPEPNVWPLTRPDPGVDLRPWQARLDARHGREGEFSRVRVVWAGTLFQTVEGKPRLQYTEPFVAEAQLSVASVPRLADDGRPVLDAKGVPITDVWHYLGDSLPDVDLSGRTDVVYGVKDYVVERAVGLYVIQELVPGFHAARGRDDSLLDASHGLYQLAWWCSSDNTEFGEYREPCQSDLDAVDAACRARAEDLHHRIDEETPAEYKRRRMRELVGARLAARRRRDASRLEESRERLIKNLVDRAGVPASSVAWSLPGLSHKKGHRP